MGFLADICRGLMKSVATRIAQAADSGINLIRFMTELLHETLVETLSAILRWNYFTRSTSLSTGRLISAQTDAGYGPTSTPDRVSELESRTLLAGATVHSGNSRAIG